MQRIQHYSLTDQVYDALKRDIVRRKLAANAKLDVNGLATTLGVSRMPVVDALTRLESEGLVEKRNRVGTFVAPVSQARFREWFETRGMIEDWAAPRIIERATQDGIEKLMCLLDDGRYALKKSRPNAFDFYEFIETYDTGFHIMLLQTTGNSLVIETFATIHSHARIGRSFISQAGQIAASAKSQADHEDIMNAVKSCDGVAIATAMRKHRESSMESTLKSLRARGID